MNTIHDSQKERDSCYWKKGAGKTAVRKQESCTNNSIISKDDSMCK